MALVAWIRLADPRMFSSKEMAHGPSGISKLCAAPGIDAGMNILYFVSGLSNRLIVFVAMLAFARILNPQSFGQYSLIVSNSLFLQVIAGSWISVGAGREFSVSDRRDWPNLIQGIAVSIAGISILLLVAALIVGGDRLVPASFQTTLIVALLTISLILFETAQAIQNALGRDRSFAATAVARGALLLTVGGIVAYYTHSVAAIIAAQILSNLLPTLAVAYRKRANLQALQLKGSRGNASRLMNFAMDGTFLFGYYIILMVITKNILASEYSVAISGIIGLAIDFFFAPLALISSSLSLSFLPRLYNKGLEDRLDIGIKSLPAKYIAIHIFVGAMYFLGTNIVIGYIAPPILPNHAGIISVAHSYAFSAFALSIMMIFAVLTIFLTARMKHSLRSIFALGVLVHTSALLWSSSQGYDVGDMVRIIAVAQLAVSIVSVGYLFALSLRHKAVVDAGDTDRVVANSGDDTGKGGGSRT